jgi:hypothetical protein
MSVEGGGVDSGDVRNGDFLGHGKENVARRLDSDGGSVHGSSGASGEARKASEGVFKGGGDARPVHSMVQNSFQDIIMQRKMYFGVVYIYVSL